MRTSAALLSLFFAGTLFAQTDSTETTTASSTYTSLNTLTRSDIERLPVTSFMQLVQGAFPFVGSASFVESDYSFVVNGFILINPNAINLSQIESIRFYPASTSLTRGSLTKKGTFMITTRPQNKGLSFATKTGLFLKNNESQLPGSSTISGSTNGMFSLNELTYTHRQQNWYLSNSFSFLENKSPAYTQTISFPNNTFIANSFFSESQLFRFSNFGGYKFNERWKAEGGFFFTSQPLMAKNSSSYNHGWASGDLQAKTEGKVNFMSGNLSATFKTSSLDNQFTAEFARYNDERNSRKDFHNSIPQGTFQEGSSLDNFNIRPTGYSLTNRFNWKMLSSSVHLDFSLIARYYDTKARERIDSAYALFGQPVVSAWSRIENRSKGWLLFPGLYFNFKNILFAEAAATYNTYGDSKFGQNQKKTVLPVGGVKLELSSLLKMNLISTLEISANYNKYITNFERYDRLGSRYAYNTPNQMVVLANPNLYGNYPPVENWLVSMAVGFAHDRMVLKTQYRNHEKQIFVWVPVPMGINFTAYTPMLELLTSRGICFELKTTVLQKEKVSWELYTMVFHDKYSRKHTAFPPKPDEVLILDAGKAPWRSALKTTAEINRFFIQASAIINFNELAIDKNGNPQEDMERFTTNFLIAGYTFPFKNKFIKSVEMSAQSSGLLSWHSYPSSKYIGVGFQANF